MEINLIILPKDNSSVQLGMKKQIKDLFNELYTNVTEESFAIKLGTDDIYIDYKTSAKSKNMLFLKMSCDETPTKSARALDYTTNRLIKGEHRKTWNIVISYDEVSQLYCCKLMPLFGEFERRTRELVYITIIKIFGVEWFDKSFSQNLQDTLKGKGNKTKLVEQALDELTYEQLKEYLFQPYCNRELVEVLEQEFALENIESLSKDDMIKIIEECRCISLWDRFFSEYEQFNDFANKINELQPFRNTVMHSKRMTFSEYEKVRKSLKIVNKMLIQAIEVLEDEMYTETTLIDVVGAFSNLIVNVLGKSMSNWVDKMKPALSSLGEILVKAAMPEMSTRDLFPAFGVISQNLSNTGRLYSEGIASTATQLVMLQNAYKLSLPDTSYMNSFRNQINTFGVNYANQIRDMISIPNLSNVPLLESTFSEEISNEMEDADEDMDEKTENP